MAQGQIQEQRLTQQQKLTQSITQQQLLQAQLTELPITQLLERIKTEMDDNPALELSPEENPDNLDPLENLDTPKNDSDDYEQEERQSALDAALESIGRDDEDLPVYQGGQSNQEDREEMVYGQTESFMDQLNEQMNMANITERQRDIMEYHGIPHWLAGRRRAAAKVTGQYQRRIGHLSSSRRYDARNRTSTTVITGVRSCRHRSTFATGMPVAADSTARPVPPKRPHGENHQRIFRALHQETLATTATGAETE